MPRYNHAVPICFTVISDHPEGEDITPTMLRAGIMARLAEIPDSELCEACLPPTDTYEEDTWVIGHKIEGHLYWGISGWGPIDRATVFTDQEKTSQVGDRPFDGDWVRSPNATP